GHTAVWTGGAMIIWGGLASFALNSGGQYVPGIILDPPSLPEGTIGVAYSQTITANGGSQPYSFALTAGALPAGFTLDPATGVLSGTTTTAGLYNFTISAADSNGCSGSRSYTLTISCSAVITLSPSALSNGTVGTAYDQ